MSLEGKKVLFIAPKFFGYENEIKKKIEDLGAKVDYYDERIKNSLIDIALIRFYKGLISKRIDKYYTNIIEKKEKYDYVFFIIPETITPELFDKLRQNQPNAEFILYMWDSFKNRKNATVLKDKFDTLYSFDSTDCSFDEKIKFKPLFYIDKFKITTESFIKRDLYFFGTGHSDRYEFIKKIEDLLIKGKYNFHYYLYLRSRVFFWIKKLFDKSFKRARISEFNFIPLSFDQIVEQLKESRIIIDLNHPNQKGLTMRTIECLGAKKKLITTNSEVIDYDFYNENNIFVVDRNNPIISEEFLESPYMELEKNIYEKYSLENWLMDIFK